MRLRLSAVLTLVLALSSLRVTAQEAPPPQPPPPTPSWTYQKGRIEKDGMVTIFYQIAQNRGPQIQPFLQKFMSPKGSIQISPPQPPGQSNLNLMMIQDVVENIDLIEKVLNILDRPAEQVQIEAQIIEKSIDNDLEVGAEFTLDQKPQHSYNQFFQNAGGAFNPDSFLTSLTPGATPFQGLNLGFFNSNHQAGVFDLRIRTLVKRGKATVLSSPYITVNNGEQARISAGDEVPYTANLTIVGGSVTQNILFKPATVTLLVTPQVVGGDFIDLDVKPDVVSISGNVTIAGQITPTFSTRNAETHLTVRSGRQIIIGGLVRTEDTESRRGIPILADIPVIGYLFGSTNVQKKKTEIIFILRPRIIKPEAEELVIPAFPK